MLRKIFIMFITITLLVGICGSVNATELKTTLDVIQQASETKYLENDQGYISKTIVDSNAETGEVTIELELSNTSKEVEEVIETEVMFVIDNSPSMDFVTESGLTRKEIVIPAAKNLAEKLLESSTNLKIGVVKFSGGNSVSSASDVMCGLTKDKTTILSTLDTLNSQSTVGGTNILAGATKANNNFTSKCQNKIIILLTDGLPNYDLNYNNSGNDSSSNEAHKVQDNTRNGLINISNSGAYVISMMTGMSESDGHTDKEGNDYGQQDLEADLQAVERIFGTTENPTVGRFYLVASADVDNIINHDILNDVVEKIQQPINTVRIVDYFPEDITENFEFSYEGTPSIGTASEEIDEETNTVSWDIETLRGDETATLRYKLKIKDMQNAELLEKTIATNEKVVLTYQDSEEKDYTVELTSSPKIKLSKVIEELTATVTYDPTTNTTGKVIATIQTNKEVNEVEGWTLSEDGKTLTKEYSENTTETVHLVDIDNITKDVEIKIENIVPEEPETPEEPKEPEAPKKDETTTDKVLPDTGTTITIIMSIIIISIILIIVYKKYSDYKEIK